jgi:hypothetical protein
MTGPAAGRELDCCCLAPKERKVIDIGGKLYRRIVSNFIRLAAIERATELIEADRKA